jgi:hypothetical protein
MCTVHMHRKIGTILRRVRRSAALSLQLLYLRTNIQYWFFISLLRCQQGQEVASVIGQHLSEEPPQAHETENANLSKNKRGTSKSDTPHETADVKANVTAGETPALACEDETDVDYFKPVDALDTAGDTEMAVNDQMQQDQLDSDEL